MTLQQRMIIELSSKNNTIYREIAHIDYHE